jgi:hypothetical protein
MASMRFAVGRPFDGVGDGRGDFWVPSATVSESDQAGWSKDSVIEESLSRPWKATGTGATWVGVDLGLSRSVDAILVEGLNVDTFTITLGDSATISSNGTFGTGAKSNISKNQRTKRYSALAVGSGSGRYAGVEIPSQGSPLDGDSDYKCARITVVETLRTLNRNWTKDYRYSPGGTGVHKPIAGGSIQSIQTGEIALGISLSGSFDIRDADQRADADLVSGLNVADRFLHFENRASDSDDIHAYLCRLADDALVAESFPTVEVAVTLREVV